MAPPACLKQPAFFLGHGAVALTMDEGDATGRWLRRLGTSLRADAPRAVLCVSAHYVAPRLRVTGAAWPTTVPDRGHGALQSFTYPAPGSPAIARRVIELLLDTGIDATFDAERGLDHGAWVPLSRMFPEHDIPVVELSLHAGGDPEHHVAIGRALEPLRREGVLIVGSGGVTHGAEVERPASDGDVLPEAARRFEGWVIDLVTRGSPYSRSRGLARFRNHEQALTAHPTDEHFLPLLVVAGAASVDKSSENVGELVHAAAQRGRSMTAFRFAR
jgi:4,5-DOPA dioxygenase extradiol